MPKKPAASSRNITFDPSDPRLALASPWSCASFWDDVQEHFEKADIPDDPIEFNFFPGPQTMLKETSAEVIGFGGAAGGSKTWGMLGLALTEHQKSIIFRREATQMRTIITGSQKIIGEKGEYNINTMTWRGLPNGRTLEFGGVKEEGDVSKWQGQDHDLKGFDEATEFSEEQVRFLMGWNRTPDPNQRVRSVLCFNPPTSTEKEWIIDFFGPWLDENHKNPAQPGEIRWFAMIDGKEREVVDGRKFVIVAGEPEYEFDPAKYSLLDIITPKSRTFIRSTVENNPVYVETGYISTLQALPEPLRSQMLHGNFKRRGADNPFKLVYREWVEAAQRRWVENEKKTLRNRRLISLGLDVAMGGDDNSILTPLYAGEREVAPGVWREIWRWETQQKWSGKVTSDGDRCALLVQPFYAEGAAINVDSIGYGKTALDSLLRMFHQEDGPQFVFGINNGSGPISVETQLGKPVPPTDRSGQFEFFNLRAQLAWRFRELLEPQSKILVELPPTEELATDLCTPTWEPVGKKIKVELKADIKKRLPNGRSPDYGDSAILAVANTGPGKAKREILFGHLLED